jgi:hypothetical protein
MSKNFDPSGRARTPEAKTKTSFWQLKRPGGTTADNHDVEHPAFQPTLPRVNLLPAAVREGITVRKIHRRFVFGALAVLIAGVGVWLLQNGTILDSEVRLTAAQRDNVFIGNKVKALAPVGQLYQQITNQETFIDEALSSEIVASDVLAELETVAGPSIAYTNIAMTFTGIPKANQGTSAAASLNLCPDADPFGTDITIGCIAFTAQGQTRSDVSAYLNRIAANPMFIGSYVTTTTVTKTPGGASQLSFTGSTGISTEGLKTLLTDEQIAALLLAAQPAPAPTDPAASPAAEG